MAVKTVQAVINGQTYNLTRNSGTGKYEATITAPNKSSYGQANHYYDVTIKATDDAGNVTTKNSSDATLGNSLKLYVKEKSCTNTDYYISYIISIDYKQQTCNNMGSKG